MRDVDPLAPESVRKRLVCSRRVQTPILCNSNHRLLQYTRHTHVLSKGNS